MSSQRRDPTTLPEWQALHREAGLVNQIIGSGVTALGRANYADRFGEYYAAFFNLSIGIERLAKLILIADHAIMNNGKLPDQSVIKKYGHDLEKLIEKVCEIAARQNIKNDFLQSEDISIYKAIIKCLNAFAAASKGRYANFAAISNPSFDSNEEPVAKWWREVVEPILKKHYYVTKKEKKVKAEAKVLNELMGRYSTVQHISETNEQISDFETMSERSLLTNEAQKYGRFYALKIIRWLANIFINLTEEKGYEAGFEAFFGHYEFFHTYCVCDRLLLTQKRWP